MNRQHSSRTGRHLLRWMVILMAGWVATGSAQEDVVGTFKHVKPQIIDVGSYTVHVLEVSDPASKFDGIAVVWTLMSKDGIGISIENIGKQGVANDIYRENSSSDDLVVLSAGFHDANNQSIGLFLSQGKEMSSVEPWTTGGVLYQGPHTFGIIPIKQWSRGPDVLYAVQAKPMVVEDGHNGILSDDGILFDRVGIGFTRSGELLVCGAFRKKNYRAFSEYDFGRLMATTVEDGGPGARTVLGLEGGPGAHIYFPELQRHFGQSGSDFVMNAIHVRRRAR